MSYSSSKGYLLHEQLLAFILMSDGYHRWHTRSSSNRIRVTLVWSSSASHSYRRRIAESDIIWPGAGLWPIGAQIGHNNSATQPRRNFLMYFQLKFPFNWAKIENLWRNTPNNETRHLTQQAERGTNNTRESTGAQPKGKIEQKNQITRWENNFPQNLKT